MAIAELAYLPLAPGVDLTTGDHKKSWDAGLKTLSSQKGYRNAFWGRQIEHPEILDLVVEWDNLEAHHAFMNDAAYPPFMETLRPLIGGHPTLVHVDISLEALSAPVTECLSFVFEASHSTEAYDKNIASFKKEGMEAAPEATGLASGWVVEEQQHEATGKDGEEGPAKLFKLFVGWPSVEVHMKFKESEAFPKVVGYLRDGPKNVEVHHTAFQKC